MFCLQAIDASKIHINESSTETTPNASPTGGSVGRPIFSIYYEAVCLIDDDYLFSDVRLTVKHTKLYVYSNRDELAYVEL